MIVTRESMKKWIIECLQERGGSAWPREVSKYVWDSYEAEPPRVSWRVFYL